jgi:iron(III) transport system ATP-binding protein
MQTTAIVVSHDPEEIMCLSDIIAFMSMGRIEQCGTAEALYHSPQSLTVMRFFESGNEIPGRAQKGFIETPLGPFPSTLPYRDGQKVIVCVRAHNLSLHGEEDASSGSHRNSAEHFKGHIIERRFLGTHHMLRVMIPELEAPLTLRTPPHRDLSSQSPISFTIEKQNAHIFPL